MCVVLFVEFVPAILPDQSLNCGSVFQANVGSMIYKAPEVGTTTPYTETSDLCVEATFDLNRCV